MLKSVANEHSDPTFKPENQLVTFYLGKELYAVPVLQVQEVLQMPELTSIPGALPHVLGIINLRGNVITIIDPRIALNVTQFPFNTQARILIISYEEALLGIVVDSIADVLLMKQPYEALSAIKQTVHYPFVQGVYEYDDHMIILLDLIKLMKSFN